MNNLVLTLFVSRCLSKLDCLSNNVNESHHELNVKSVILFRCFLMLALWYPIKYVWIFFVSFQCFLFVWVYALHTFNVEGTHIQELVLVNLDGLRVALGRALKSLWAWALWAVCSVKAVTMRLPEAVDDGSKASNIVTATAGGCDKCRGRVVRVGDAPRQWKGG